MKSVNIGILAHVDAGKTSLTERLLFDSGAIDRLGSVDAGTTQTDTGDIERRRGITIRSAVAPFVWRSGDSATFVSPAAGPVGDRQVNLIDTPGHSDFVAEVQRAISVLDGAVLVISAVEGVQPHTRVLLRTLRALRLPTLIFVNKIDRTGARDTDLIDEISRRLTSAVLPMGDVRHLGTPAASFTPAAAPAPGWAPVLAERDDVLLAALVDDLEPDPTQVWRALLDQTAAGLVHPLLFGSALSGAGLPALFDAIGRLLPPAPAAEPTLRGRVFAIERSATGEKVAYVRSYGGDLRRRQRVTLFRREPDGGIGTARGQVTALEMVGDAAEHLAAGHIAKVHGLAGARIGDQIGSATGLDAQAHFPPPSLATTVRARESSRSDALHKALVDLADADPLIRTQVTGQGEISVLLYGDVQKEVIATTLAEVHGIEAVFEPSRIMHLERPVGVGHALEIIGHGFLATVGLRVEPGEFGEGVVYRLDVELGSLPLSFHKAIEDSARRALAQGVYGWPVTDIRITLTHSGFWARPGSAAGDFRDLTPHVLMRALAMAGTRVYEPCQRFDLEVPPDRFGAVTAALAHLGATVTTADPAASAGDPAWRITGSLPTRLVAAFQRQLPNLSNGEGVWSAIPLGDRPVVGKPPYRPRTDGNPFDRVEYTRFLAQRHLVSTS